MTLLAQIFQFQKPLFTTRGLQFLLCKVRFETPTSVKHFSTSTAKSSREVVFLGSDSFAIPSLIALMKNFGSDSVTVVVSNPKNTVGNFAQKCSLKTVIWSDFKENFQKKDKEPEYYLGVVASFGYLIPENVINRFQKGIFNVHPSLLPKYRGAAPIHHTIINGDSTTGVSIMKIAAHKFDVGPLYKVITLPVHPNIRAPELHKILAEIGADALAHVLADLDHYSQNPIVQKDHEASLAKKLTPDMANVNWSDKNPAEIYNLFRGLYGSFKLRTTYDEKCVDLDEIGLIKIDPESENMEHSNKNISKPTIETDFSTFYASPCTWKISKLPENVLPGHVIFKNFVLCIKCGDSSVDNPNTCNWIFVKKIKVRSKWMTAQDFENGFLRKGRKRGIFRFKFIPDENVDKAIKPIRAFNEQAKSYTSK